MKFPERTEPCVSCGEMTWFAKNNRNGLCRACGLLRRGNQKREVTQTAEEVERKLDELIRREHAMPWERVTPQTACPWERRA